MSDDLYRIQIIGKIDGATDRELEMFNQAERLLLKEGYEVFNPLTLAKDHPNMDYQWYMKKCLQSLVSQDAIFCLPTWVDSDGANVEYRVADSIGLEIADVWDFLD